MVEIGLRNWVLPAAKVTVYVGECRAVLTEVAVKGWRKTLESYAKSPVEELERFARQRGVQPEILWLELSSRHRGS